MEPFEMVSSHSLISWVDQVAWTIEYWSRLGPIKEGQNDGTARK